MKISELYRKGVNKIIKDNLKDIPGLFIIDYSGVSAADMNVLRESLRKTKSRLLVAKNSIIKRAFSGTDNEGLSALIEGPSSIVFTKDDPAASAKVLYDFRKEHESLKLKVGLLKDKVLDTKAIEALAKLPSRNVLVAKAVGGMKAPLSSFVYVLSGNLRKLLYILDSVKNKKQ
ncbi:MAG: 50S ribosomal protein L10 [Candidatus Omnitrophica bacterium]|nr:50S ribosomal protein L10 [Candidatus Omnitrophota bacterium]MDD5236469.1 50S ribosomal protein L10 [Candidatus Omnitrophota bacterium]MDD5610842.1 50S ribosomal protein L10 [Candidatus Omnitrophota bacterium]